MTQYPCFWCKSLRPLTQALMNVNARLRELYPDSEELFDIVLMTNNHAQVGVRLINSINHYGTLRPKPNIVDCSARCSASLPAEATGLIKNSTQSNNYTMKKSCCGIIRNEISFFTYLQLAFYSFRFNHREILHDGREKSCRLPKGLHDEPLPLQGLGESHRGHRGRWAMLLLD